MSRCTYRVRWRALPPELLTTATPARALASFLVRQAARAVRGEQALRVDAGGQEEVLERSSCTVSGEDGSVTLRLGAALPGGHGRRIDAREAERLLCRVLPGVVEQALRHPASDAAAVERFVETVEDSVALRNALAGRGLVGFVADGAVLPRRSGVDDRPAARAAVWCRSPRPPSCG